MQADGLHTNGANPLDKASQGLKSGSGARKPESKPDGKSFADALGKAKGAGQTPSVPAAPSESASAEAPPPEMGSYIDQIRLKLQTGYYNSQKVDDALSDKLSGFFDDAV